MSERLGIEGEERGRDAGAGQGGEATGEPGHRERQREAVEVGATGELRRGRRFEGRFLDGQLVLIYGNAYAPDGGYAVDVRSGEVYRNGDLVGWARQLYFDRAVLGWWVEYESWRGSPLDMPSVAG